jgi:hypothetical protein
MTSLPECSFDQTATEEDRRSGFERGGWALGAGDDETRAFINRTYQRAGAFLSGDVAAAIGELGAKPGNELQVHGSGALVR